MIIFGQPSARNHGNSQKKACICPHLCQPQPANPGGFQTPFDQQLAKDNRWVVLAHLIPWDEVCAIYLKHVEISSTGRPAISPRVVIGSLIIKHLGNLGDRETVEQIRENMYMQYFLGYSSFTTAQPFDPTLFVEFRKRLGMDNLNAINDKIIELKTNLEASKANSKLSGTNQDPTDHNSGSENRGRVIFDATACPQDIAYPTDLNLLSDAREKAEHLIDILYDPELHEKKPRTYRKIARRRYLHVAQKKNKSHKEIHKANGSQLRFLRRDLNSINRLLSAYPQIPLDKKDLKYLHVINTVYDQQKKMYGSHSHSVEDRIVSIHQPHVRPIVRGKSQAKVEFGAKIHVSIIDGISFLDELSWDAFNEGSHMMDYVERYHARFGCYPRELLADKIYCTRANRAALKEKGIKLLAKPLGRPSAVLKHVSPGERNPIEGKFGQAKTAYGLDRIRARLRETSESWIACIFLVLNLVKLAGVVLPCLLLEIIRSFSAKTIKKSILRFAEEIYDQLILPTVLLNPGKVGIKIIG